MSVMEWHQAITWTSVDLSSVSNTVDIHLRAISQDMLQPSIPTISLKFAYLKFNSNLLGSSELPRPNCITVLIDSRFSEHLRGVWMKDTGSYFLIFYHWYAVCLIDSWGLLTHWSWSDCHLADENFQCSLLNKNHGIFFIKIALALFLRSQLSIIHHWSG